MSAPINEIDKTVHETISSYFLGPKAENIEYLKKNISDILDAHATARKNNFHPTDKAFIGPEIQSSQSFQNNTKRVSKAVLDAARLLGQHSGPFWSTRYVGHMCMDISMPALLGYFMTMMYNPNNVVSECSPLTTIAELECGNQLCQMFGFNVKPQDELLPPGPEVYGWGHIACDGTVANLESIWAARNLKFYPLSLRKAMDKGGKLEFIGSKFKVNTWSNGVSSSKPLTKLTGWELVNLEVPTVLDLPVRLQEEFGISSSCLDDALKDLSIQSTGKDSLEKEFDIKPMKYLIANTKHYSWPKGLAITGIGANNLIGIDVDSDGRLDINSFKEHLADCFNNNNAVYAAVSIMGTTEEGAIDPLESILELRDQYRQKGFSFVVHADAAWGGYFASMLDRRYRSPPTVPPGDSIPHVTMRPYATKQFSCLKSVDSITVDPHKAGYAPYPAGGLCYRDGRMRHLITWTTPYITRDAKIESIGIYGVEGSKPGASAMGAWFTNQIIGLNPEGYGRLLGEVSFTCTRFAAEWATMETKTFQVVPLNKLPSERNFGDVDEEKKFIRENILGKRNQEIWDNDRARNILSELGPDLNVNAFACNFRLLNGEWNQDVAEANYFNRRIVDALSIRSPSTDISKLPLIIVSTEFLQHEYGNCATQLKGRMRLHRDDPTDLFVLRSVIMSAFSTDGNFVREVAKGFEDAVEKEVAICQKRLRRGADKHSFIMQGTDTIYLVHRPNYHTATQRYQLIFSIDLSSDARNAYNTRRLTMEGVSPILTTEGAIDVSAIDMDTTFYATIDFFDGQPAIRGQITVGNIIVKKPLVFGLKPGYPEENMPFYIYGSGNEKHIDHQLTRHPNVQLSAEKVSVSLDISDYELAYGVPFEIIDVRVPKDIPIREKAMQPLDAEDNKFPADYFFGIGSIFTIRMKTGGKTVSGTMTLPNNVYRDRYLLNKDPNGHSNPAPAWLAEFNKIGQSIEDGAE